MNTSAMLTPADVAKIFDVTPSRIRAMDAVLKPSRLANGNRVYDPRVVDRVRKERAKAGR